MADVVTSMPRVARCRTWLRAILVTGAVVVILVRSLANQVKHHRRQARDHQRQESLEQLLDHSSLMAQEALASQVPSPSEAASRREQAVLLADAVDRLPPDYREAFVLRTVEHVPFEEVAVRMERSIGAVRMLWARAVKRLNQMLTEDR